MKTIRVVFDVALLIATVVLFSCQSSDKAMAQYVLKDAYPNLPNFSSPIYLTTIPDGSNRFIVMQQAGKVYSVDASSATDTSLFFDISHRIVSGGETGLLGCAFHPKYTENHFVYFNYTANVGNQLTSFISRFTVSGPNFDTIDPASELVLLTVDQPFANHNGGCLQFGNDGLLYAGFGDGGSGGDPFGNGQKKTTLLGKILRIDVDHPADGKNYGIPATNPFKGNTTDFKEEIYAYGLRNPWRFSFDKVTGKLWCGDVGQGAWEEVDTIELGKNYGWNIMEGKHCYNASDCDQTGLTLPILDYPHGAEVSITGGYVYRGTQLPELQGKYLYGDYGSGKIWAITDASPVINQLVISNGVNISSFGVTPDNEVLVVGIGTGRLYKIVNTNSVAEQPAKKAFTLRLASNKIVRSVSTLIGYVDLTIPTTSISASLVDMLGNEFALPNLANSSAAMISLDLKPIASQLTPGMYFLRVSDGKLAISDKIVVE
jgi:glucose/arabinose dehydrogenase